MDLDPHTTEDWERRTRPQADACVGTVPGLSERPRPLRVALLGWARLSAQARDGSGLNLSVSDLAAGLVSMGHRVSYLRSGVDYSLRPGMRVTLCEIWRGVGCFDLLNSPNLAPANFNFRNVPEQVQSPAHTRLVLAWLRAVGAQVAHIHSLEGFGLDVVEAIRACGIPVIITPHNYYALCPQVDLLAREQRVCEDNQGGLACVGCLSHAPDAAKHRSWRRRYQTTERWFGPHAMAVARDRLRLARESLIARLKTPVTGPVVLPGSNGHAPAICPLPAAPADQNERVLKHRPLVVLNDYGRRRAAGVAAISSADAVLCPSRFLMRVHEAHGVDPARMRHVQLGQPHFDALYAAAHQSPYFTARPWSSTDPRPLRLAYFGNSFPNKGLATLVEAMRTMPASLAARVHVSIFAGGDDRPFRHALAGRGHVTFFGGYDVSQLAAIHRVIDACVFPNMGLENSPFVVLESLHAGRFVIASRLGGPTDWIDEGRNGLLFAAGNVPELTDRIRQIVEGQVSLPSMQQVQECSRLRTYPQYVQDVQQSYEHAIAARSGAQGVSA